MENFLVIIKNIGDLKMIKQLNKEEITHGIKKIQEEIDRLSVLAGIKEAQQQNRKNGFGPDITQWPQLQSSKDQTTTWRFANSEDELMSKLKDVEDKVMRGGGVYSKYFQQIGNRYAGCIVVTN